MSDLLVITAHPDDEALYSGGVIAKVAAAGRPVALVTLTRGGAGRTLGMCRSDALAAVREAELQAATQALGVGHLEVFDLPDRALADHRLTATTAVEDCLQRLKPRVVVSFPPNGMNGHTDHVAVHHIVRDAVAHSRCGAAVFYFAADGTFTEPARPEFLPAAEVNQLWLAPTCHVDVGDVVTQKLVAMACHETQARSVVKHLRLYPARILTESFHAASGDNTILKKLLS